MTSTPSKLRSVAVEDALVEVELVDEGRQPPADGDARGRAALFESRVRIRSVLLRGADAGSAVLVVVSPIALSLFAGCPRRGCVWAFYSMIRACV